MNAIQQKRLLNVAKALRDAAAQPKLKALFTMSQYGYSTHGNGELYSGETGKLVKIEEAKTCGTPACALGHYAARRDLQREFVLDETGDVVDKDGNSFSSEQLERHFGISAGNDDPNEVSDEAEDIFGGYGCDRAKTPIQAARYIEKFVAAKAKAREQE